jgi:hypothetical protein
MFGIESKTAREPSPLSLVTAESLARPPNVADGIQNLFVPIVDGDVLPRDGSTAMALGKRAHVPIVLGSTAEPLIYSFVYDGGPIDWSLPLSPSRYHGHIEQICNYPAFHLCRAADVPELVDKHYPCSPSDDCRTAAINLLTDSMMICMRKRVGRWLSQLSPTFVYEWRWRLRSCAASARAGIEPSWGAHHESELPFIFPSFSNCSRTAEGEALSDAWGALLDGLLATGEPGCMPTDAKGGCVPWPAYNPDAGGGTMLLGNLYNRSAPWAAFVRDDVFTSGGVLGDGHRSSLEDLCELWDRLYWMPGANGLYVGSGLFNLASTPPDVELTLEVTPVAASTAIKGIVIAGIALLSAMVWGRRGTNTRGQML